MNKTMRSLKIMSNETQLIQRGIYSLEDRRLKEEINNYWSLIKKRKKERSMTPKDITKFTC